MNKWFHYIRISTRDKQKYDRQEKSEELKEFCKRMNIEKEQIITLEDVGTGYNFDRPNYQLMKKVVSKGDCIIVHAVDRFGRNYIEGKREFAYFLEKGVKVYVLNRPMLEQMYNLNDNMSRFMANFLMEWELMSAEEELKRIKERQRQGIEVAKQKGVYLGRPKIDFPDQWEEIYNRWIIGDIKAVEAMESLGLKKTTFYNLVKEYKKRAN